MRQSSCMEFASIQTRFCAYLIDTAILLVPTLIIVLLLNHLPLILHLSYICIHCSYFTYFLSSKRQATPGQQLMHIYTVTLNNSKIDIILAFDRSLSQFFLPVLNSATMTLIDYLSHTNVLVSILNILKVIIILLTLIWYLITCLSNKKQALHDIIFDTFVIKKR
ncbi:RDD family protein [Wolbachia endosymbiont of Howardula sp.]|uniref:RDD family protein n=1 Tax=Wolbachia endosymbiont of Howardula sp. TaxID=2916816 RepID=UPI00217E60D9|nr:RDD family protein [Wolbachia endosymbiont of Howardula sp.]UWI83262.1 RDD family protein [Wolbachia endosymbiont of Howardula sp.]